MPLSIFVPIQYIADPGGALWGPSSALSARMEEREVAMVLKVLRVGQAVEQAGMLEPRSHILHQGRGAAAKAKGEWS